MDFDEIRGASKKELAQLKKRQKLKRKAMPFKSKAQIKKMRELEKQGKVPSGTVNRWAQETPSLLKLPERKSPKKAGKK